MNPENRDGAAATQLKSRSEGLELVLERQPEAVDRAIRASLPGTADDDAHHHIAYPDQPSPQAQQLALHLAELALPAIEHELVATQSDTLKAGGYDWPIELPAVMRPELARLGIPLVGAVAPTLAHGLARFRSTLSLETGFQESLRQMAARRLADTIESENAQWETARHARTGIEEMPYAFRWYAMWWLWHPLSHSAARAPAICMRCGTLVRRNRRTKLPLCEHCMNEPNSARAWPAHAIAPAGRGTWWLRCPRCDPSGFTPFRAQRNRIYCEQHTTAKLTVAAR